MTLNASLTPLTNTSTNPIIRLGRYHAIAINRRTLLRDSDTCIAKQPFDQTRPLEQHNQLLFHYSRNDQTREALHLFVSLCRSGLCPDRYTMSCILNVCARSFDGTAGEHVHCQCVKSGLMHHVFIGSSLVDMYMKTGSVRDARRAFNEMGERNVVSWTSLLRGYSWNGFNDQVWELFCQMQVEGHEPNSYTFSTVIKALADQGNIAAGMQIHVLVVKHGFEAQKVVCISLITMLSNSRMLRDAFGLFSLMDGVQDVVSWTAMISGYLQNGGTDEALNLFSQMRREGKVKPQDFTYAAILTVPQAVFISQVHAQVIKTNYEKSTSAGTALTDAYAKIGNIEDAVNVFELIEAKNIISWSAMLAGYARIGETEEAAKIFQQLTREGIKPNEFTFSSITNACAAPTASVEQGKQFHAYAIKMRLNNALCVSNSLVTMYAKRGNIDSAHEVFKRQKEKDLVSWNSMISGYAQHGQAKKALEVFEEMQKRNLEVNAITFTSVLSACTHAGLVDKGQYYFNVMIYDHQINPTMEHYSCLIDLYSRAGMLEKAMDIINGMPFPPNATVWSILLAASGAHCNIELEKLAAEKIISLEPQKSAAYVALSNMYAEAGNWQEVFNVRKLMHKRKVKKAHGYSWIEVKNKTYTFLAGDSSHPLSDLIYSKLSELNIQLRDAGYQPDTNYVFHDVGEQK